MSEYLDAFLLSEFLGWILSVRTLRVITLSEYFMSEYLANTRYPNNLGEYLVSEYIGEYLVYEYLGLILSVAILKENA